MKRIMKKRLYKVRPYQPGRPIDEVKRELGLSDVIKLASNESPYPPSPKVLQAINRAAENINRYPDGGCYYLRQALARKLNVKEDQLIFGNGSDELIILALRACVEKGDEVIMARPSFLIYPIGSQIIGARIKQVPLKNMHYDLTKMVQAVTPKTKIIFLANPDNPNGTYMAKKELVPFLRKVRNDVLVFLDEAYYEYGAVNKDFPDGLKLAKTFRNLIVTRTFSKMYGLAGLRIGYGIGQKETISILNRIREPFNVNSLAQAAALACLKDERYYRKLARGIESQKRMLYQALDAMGLPYVKTATNFILIDVRKDCSWVAQELMQRGVIVRHMKSWGYQRFIRVTIGTMKENKRFLKALKLVLDLS